MLELLASRLHGCTAEMARSTAEMARSTAEMARFMAEMARFMAEMARLTADIARSTDAGQSHYRTQHLLPAGCVSALRGCGGPSHSLPPVRRQQRHRAGGGALHNTVATSPRRQRRTWQSRPGPLKPATPGKIRRPRDCEKAWDFVVARRGSVLCRRAEAAPGHLQRFRNGEGEAARHSPKRLCERRRRVTVAEDRPDDQTGRPPELRGLGRESGLGVGHDKYGREYAGGLLHMSGQSFGVRPSVGDTWRFQV